MSGLTIPELVSEFHTLEGSYLAEKQRSFGRYFTKVKSLLTTKETEECFIKTIVPQNRIEEKFRMEILLHYKCVQELWNIILSEDVSLMGKILRTKWFFTEGFADITGNQLVYTLLNQVSYLVRIRILNKLNSYMGNELKIQEYFDNVMSVYGQEQACLLLPSCNMVFILSKIIPLNITLGEHDLVRVYKRHPTFPEQYFALKKQSEQGIRNYSELLRCLALHDTEQYWKLKHEFDLRAVLNRKQSTKVIKLYKPHIMKKLRVYTHELNLKALLACISKSEFAFFLKEVFPLKSEEFHASWVDDYNKGLFVYLKKLDKSLWLPMIEQTYYKAYKEQFRECLHLITSAILQLMPIEERGKFIEAKMAQDNSEEWICYYSPEKAMGLINNKINLTAQIPQRSRYIKMLVKTCKVNNDMAALLEVLKYFENRHKNDDVQLKRDFFSSIQQSFEIDKLSIEHIKVLLDLLKLFNIKHGSWFWGSPSLLAKIVKHHVNNNLPIRDVLIFYFNVEGRRDIINLFKDSPKETKFVLLAIAEMMEDLANAIHNEHDDKWTFYACYVNSVIRWNNQNKKDQIPLQTLPFLPIFFKEIAGIAKYESSLIKYMKATNYDQGLQNFLCDAYWGLIRNNKGIAFNCSETDYWFAKYKPQYISTNIEIIFSSRYCNGRNFQKFVRNVDISGKFLEKAVDIISNMSKMEIIPTHDIYKYKKAILILASSSEFMNLIRPYLPLESSTVSPNDDPSLYEIRNTIVQALVNLNKPSNTFETLLVFLKGDFLHSSLSTLYKIAQNTPEVYLKDFLRTLSSRAVSVRKHAIFLGTALMNTDTVFDILKNSGEKENNPSLRKCILKCTLKYFLANCNESIWHLLKAHVGLLNPDDVEGYQQMLVLDKIPFKYQSDYVELLWDSLAMSENKTINQFRFTLLGSIHIKVYPTLSNTHCDTIIKAGLTNASDIMLSNKIHEFIFNCFLYGDETRISQRMDCVFGIFRNLLNSSDITSGASREVIQDFIIKCCTYLIFKKKSEEYADLVNILEILRLKWSANFTSLLAFREFMILNFTALYFECSRTKFQSVNFVEKLGVMFDNMVASYGESIIQLFSTISRQFLHIICVAEELDNNECLLHTLKTLSANYDDTPRLILVINTLPIKVGKTTVLRTLHMAILDGLRMSTNDTIQIHLYD